MTENLVQRSPEWFAACCGSVGSSRVPDVVARTKTGWGASRANAMAELICERLTGITAESYINAAMQHGIDCEPEARLVYEFLTNRQVTEVGLFRHPTIRYSHASPDGLIGTDGLIEIKCPNTATHIDTLLSETIAGRYLTQIQWQMSCTGRQWCDFVSYDPRLPDSMRIWIKRVERDNERIEELEELVADFLGELDEKLARLRARYIEPLLLEAG